VSEDLATLFGAILADPQDPALRLRYADAIEPTGPDHAELIRLQLEDEAARRSHRLLDQTRTARIDALVAAGGPLLAAPVAPMVDGWRVLRGFVEQITLSADAFLRTGDELFRRAPIRHLRLTGAAGHVESLAASPLLDQVVSLDLSESPIGDAGAVALARSPYLGRLRWLGLFDTGIGAAGAEALAASIGLPELRYLAFGANPVDITPEPAGMGWDGSMQDARLPPLGEELVRRHGTKRWLTFPGTTVLFWPPQIDEV
jgi:uncharacterized protein (TIGR02996 family)